MLLPIGKSHHPNMTILRARVSADEQSMTIFLRDITHYQDAGFVAVCDRVPGEAFYMACLSLPA